MTEVPLQSRSGGQGRWAVSRDDSAEGRTTSAHTSSTKTGDMAELRGRKMGISASGFDFDFVESVCYNSEFRRTSVFVPVSRKAGNSTGALYVVDISIGASHLVCQLPAGGEFYGSILTATGLAYIADFSLACIWEVDLNAAAPVPRCAVVFPTLATGAGRRQARFLINDLAFDAATGYLYAAGNSGPVALGAHLSNEEHERLSMHHVTNNTGQVLRARPERHETVEAELFAQGFRVLAGAVVVPADTRPESGRHGSNTAVLWLSELTHLVAVPLCDDGECVVGPSDRNWVRYRPFPDRLLADNLRLSSCGRKIWLPFYTEVSPIASACLQSRPLSGVALRVLSGLASLRCTSISSTTVDEMPKMSSFEPCHTHIKVALFDPSCPDEQVQMDSLPFDGRHFDGRVTHVEQVGQELVFVNWARRSLYVAPLAGVSLRQPAKLDEGRLRRVATHFLRTWSSSQNSVVDDSRKGTAPLLQRDDSVRVSNEDCVVSAYFPQ